MDIGEKVEKIAVKYKRAVSKMLNVKERLIRIRESFTRYFGVEPEMVEVVSEIARATIEIDDAKSLPSNVYKMLYDIVRTLDGRVVDVKKVVVIAKEVVLKKDEVMRYTVEEYESGLWRVVFDELRDRIHYNFTIYYSVDE